MQTIQALISQFLKKQLSMAGDTSNITNDISMMLVNPLQIQKLSPKLMLAFPRLMIVLNDIKAQVNALVHKNEWQRIITFTTSVCRWEV